MNAIDQIIGINCAEMGSQKAQCTHAVALLLLMAAGQEPDDQFKITVAVGILATALGIEVDKCAEIIHAGAADLGIKL